MKKKTCNIVRQIFFNQYNEQYDQNYDKIASHRIVQENLVEEFVHSKKLKLSRKIIESW